MATKVTLLRDLVKITERLAVLGADRDRAVAKAVEAGCTRGPRWVGAWRQCPGCPQAVPHGPF